MPAAYAQIPRVPMAAKPAAQTSISIALKGLWKQKGGVDLQIASAPMTTPSLSLQEIPRIDGFDSIPSSSDLLNSSKTGQVWKDWVYPYIRVYIYIYIYIYLSIYPSIHPSIHPSIYLSISAYPCIHINSSIKKRCQGAPICERRPATEGSHGWRMPGIVSTRPKEPQWKPTKTHIPSGYD